MMEPRALSNRPNGGHHHNKKSSYRGKQHNHSKSQHSKNAIIVPPPNESPTPAQEIALSRYLENYLVTRGDVYESWHGEDRRRRIIEKLHEILVRWVAETGSLKSPPIAPEHIICGGGVQLKIFGSTRLGVHTPDADIDVLCIAPCWITRSDFFTSFVDKLRGRYDVSMVSAVPEAYTPVVKFIIDSQPLDVIFVSLPFSHFIPPDLDILSPKVLLGLDDAAVRSINGSRVAERILSLVPNFMTFSITLRAVKHWARERSIYSNVLGFLGGVNYAILVARICQMHPLAPPFALLANFYSVFASWPWPQPVMIAGFEDISPFLHPMQPSHISSCYVPPLRAHQDWAPSHRGELMPILTPCYPSMNSAYNVGLPQWRVLHEELTRGYALFQKWFQKQALARSLNASLNQKPTNRPAAPAPPCPPCISSESAPSSASTKENNGPAGNALAGGGCEGDGALSVSFPFAELFKSSSQTFFQRYSCYLQVDIVTADTRSCRSDPACSHGNTALEHRHWFGFLESKIRSLVIDMEAAGAQDGLVLHPQANCFHRHTSKATLMNAAGAEGAVCGKGEAKSAFQSPARGRAEADNSQFTSPVCSTISGATTSTGGSSDDDDGTFISTFFVGVSLLLSGDRGSAPSSPSTCEVQRLVLTSPAILDLKYRASTYRARENECSSHSNSIAFALLERAHLPGYIYANKPEPSNLQTCTPAKGKKGIPGGSTASKGAAKALLTIDTLCNPVNRHRDGREGGSEYDSHDSLDKAGASLGLQFDAMSPTHLKRPTGTSTSHPANASLDLLVDGKVDNSPLAFRVEGIPEQSRSHVDNEDDLASRLGLGCAIRNISGDAIDEGTLQGQNLCTAPQEPTSTAISAAAAANDDGLVTHALRPPPARQMSTVGSGSNGANGGQGGKQHGKTHVANGSHHPNQKKAYGNNNAQSQQAATNFYRDRKFRRQDGTGPSAAIGTTQQKWGTVSFAQALSSGSSNI